MSKSFLYVADKQAIAQRFIEGTSSLSELAKEVGETETTVYNWVIKHCKETGAPLPLFPAKTIIMPKRYSVSMEQAICLVTAEGYTTRQAARKLGVNQKTLESNLKDYFEEMKNRMPEKKKSIGKKTKNFSSRFKKKVAKARLLEGLSIEETANRFHVGKSSVSRWVNQYHDDIFKENGLLQTQEVEDNNDIEDSMDKVNIEPLEDTGGREEIPNQTDHTNIVTDVDNILVTYLQAEIHRLKDENSKLRQALTILTTT